MRLYWDCPEALSADECDAVIALAQAGPMSQGLVYGEQAGAANPAVRAVDTSFHRRSEGADWLHDRLDALFGEAARALGVSVAPMREPIQVMRYGPGCHFQTWHSDAGFDQVATRVISVSVELSQKSDYDGGALEIIPEIMGRARTMERGGARFFLSRALHRVTPVTRGVRWSLVNWTGQPAAEGEGA